VVGPIDAIQTLASGTPDPASDGGNTHAELASDASQRLALADGGYHGPTTLLKTLCLLMGLPRNESVFDE
jgi:hypothetical protein